MEAIAKPGLATSPRRAAPVLVVAAPVAENTAAAAESAW